jgi:hypothetical protein
MIRSFVQQKLTDHIGKILPKYPRLLSRLSYVQGRELIVAALSSTKEAAGIFRSLGLPNCRMCPLHKEESLQEAAQSYGIDQEKWLIRLNFEIFIRQQEMLNIS